MKRLLGNERGSIMYAVLIILTLMVLIPGIILLPANNQLHNLKTEYESKATQLAVSGMESFVKYPGGVSAQKTYIQSNYYGSTPLSITLPEGTVIKYRQYLIKGTVADSDALSLTNVEDPSALSNILYKCVVTAAVGDTNGNQLKDSDEPDFFIKKMIATLDLSTGMQQTAMPVISPAPRAGDTAVSGSSEASATITVTVSGSFSGAFAGTASSSGAYSVAMPQQLAQGDVITVTAQAPGKTVSPSASATVLAPVQQTAAPSVSPAPVAGDTSVTGIAESSSTITLTVSGSFTGTFTTIAATGGAYTVSVSPNILAQGDVVSVTAQAPGKTVSSPTSVTTLAPTQQTATPVINPLPVAGDTAVAGTAEAGSSMVVNVVRSGTTTTYTGTATSAGTYSIPTMTLQQNDTVQVLATAPFKLQSNMGEATVQAAGTTSTGYIMDVGTGTTQYLTFPDTYSTSNQLVVTSSLGDYTTSNPIDLTAASGIAIDSGVSLTSTATGSGSGFSLTTTGGNIDASGVTLTNSGSSVFSTITIDSAGDVHLENSNLTADRNISITAGGSIYLNNATISSLKNNSSITFTLNSGTGKIYVDGLWLNQAATASTPGTNQITGTLKAGSGTLNGQTTFP